ncbi:MAG: hypothetical protein KKG75_02970 [Nanoarchaeota archaeon]|nr:hypothetical protein [Nanoarchaeota archaeon]
MVGHTAGLHHFQIRKRIFEKREKYPSSSKVKRYMDKVVFVMGAFGPIMTIPQLYEIWIKKNAAGVSAISWGSYLIIAIFWLFYGIVHKEKPLIFMYILWIIFDIFIVAGTIIYG